MPVVLLNKSAGLCAPSLFGPLNRADRFLGIIPELQRTGGCRGEDLAKRFETSIRTIYRDITALGVEFVERRFDEGYWRAAQTAAEKIEAVISQPLAAQVRELRSAMRFFGLCFGAHTTTALTAQSGAVAL